MESADNPTLHSSRALAPPNRHHSEFCGFAPPTSNTTYTPNQFFDVCLPHSSRGTVRLVAYLIRKTLGWCDADGRPQEERVQASYHELIQNAGISREMIHEAINEAIASRFIRCVRQARPKSAGQNAVSALYELRWSDSPEYVKNPKEFRGFYEQDGHRTYIPNQFFDRVIRHETLAVIKVVGSIVRFSIGFQARRGNRRQQAELSYSHIQNYARIKNRSTLSQAIEQALARNYIIRVNEGYFDPAAGSASRAAVYAIRWADTSPYYLIGQKNVPGIYGSDRSEICTDIGQKNVPEDRSEKRTGIEIKQRNKTFKQQQGADAKRAVEQLIQEGFDQKTAEHLSGVRSNTDIENQIRWLPHRVPMRNRLGMLRRAIEEGWHKPPTEKLASAQVSDMPGHTFARYFYAGYAGLTTEPTVEPSPAEARAAQPFASTLLKDATTPDDVRLLARAFGQFARIRQSNGRKILTITLALRVYGDEFLALQERSRHEAAAAKEKHARDRHRAEHEPQWFGYLALVAEQFKHDQPQDHARFADEYTRKQERIRRAPWAAPSRQEYLDDRQFLIAFQRDFASRVLDFWQWDSELNPAGLTAAIAQ